MFFDKTPQIYRTGKFTWKHNEQNR